MSDPHRLPPTARPDHYRLRFEPDLVAETFTGSVDIEIEVLTDADHVVLNAEDLEITEASIDGEAVDTSVDTETQRLTLHRAVSPGPATLSISFTGRFNDQLVGPYLSRFSDDDGDHVLATTQFEATHARKAFPCWDEPAHKATFDVELVIDADHQAVSNTAEIERTSLDDGRDLVRFATTMKMSTYLVAFVTGPLRFTDPVDVDGVPLRVVHVPGRDAALAEFALDCGAFALRYFADYFDIAYPGDKVDLIAIPDFAFGAMENLGCITFREALLLVDPAASTQPELQRVADVINHELAHMWFGDLVTMVWWNGLWLNEAFATFMEMRCTDAYRPEWQRWVDFGLSRSAAFDTDSLRATRPIEFEVTSPEDAEGMFDILTYEKGAAVVRMLEQFLGEDLFRAGIRRYMRQHSYGNAETTDLWDAIEAETGERGIDVPVRAIMDSWIFQGGYPLVSVELAADGRSVTISQERFGFAAGVDAPTDAADADPATWLVPIRFRWQPADGDPVADQVLLEGESIEIDLPETASWVVANAEGASFLRVAYPPEALETLAEVALEQLTSVERYALVDDAWASVLAGTITPAGFLHLLEMLTAEEDRAVWQRMISGFAALDRLLDEDSRPAFQAIVHDAVAPALAGLTLTPQPDETDLVRQLRADLIRAMGRLANDHEIQEEAKRTAAEARRDPELVEASIAAAATDVVAWIGDEADLDDFLREFRENGNPQIELRHLYATADFPELDHHRRVRSMILDDEIRSQNAPFWLQRAIANRRVGRDTWAFVQEHWETLTDRFATSAVVRMVASLATIDEPGDPEATVAFFDEHPIEHGKRTLEQILERQAVNADLREREAAAFRAIVRN